MSGSRVGRSGGEADVVTTGEIAVPSLSQEAKAHEALSTMKKISW